MEFIPQFGGLLWTLAAFVVALSIIVAVHEYGHYIVGRWCGIKADVFSIGFGPVLASRMDRHGTRWQIAALPLGGYVKFRGDANAASVGADGSVAEMTAAQRAETMTGAALWRRSATVAAGPVFNFMLSILVFAAFVLWSGAAVETPVIGKTKAMPEDVVLLEQGDLVLSVEGQPVETLQELSEVSRTLPPSPTVTYEIVRDGSSQSVEAAHLMPARIETVNARSAAWDIGLAEGDVIRAIDGTPIHSFQELQAAVAAGEGVPLSLDVWRAGEMLEFTLTPRSTDLPQPDGTFETRYLIGITGALFFDPQTESVGPLTAMQQGVEQTIYIVRSSLSALAHISTGAISSCNLSGPVGIAEVSGAAASQGVDSFIWMIAVLSTAVGLLNLFPIPVLDGGHLVFHAYEAVRGRPPSDGAVRVLMSVGISVMLTVMVFATFNDLIFCP
ncbi:RIP metalloprotease RseP [Jannaschia seohaensis]|uniref:Zinc metalloprotease n=1 Tax=Jannaschia seohaensis TaxID=475081 RepID=A0A2Y9AN76_9RHOB|nr:RIP metalloprotease RseP [Jannaschia seohaensis]PWJ19312.1 regulator of sigma E protease [Jannaschia seohaensis]SSA45974.1 regulator of sigma E protease [Jannaschia seohaensis]